MKKLANRLKTAFLGMSPAVRASLLFTLCGLLQKGVSFLVVPIYTRIMPAEAYGEYSVFLSWYQIIMVFTTLNMWNYLINNGMTKYGNDRKNFIASLQGLSTVITVVWFVIYLPLSGIWKGATGLSIPIMLMMFLELLFMPAYEYYCAVKRYDYDAGKVVVLTVVLTILIPLISIPMILYMPEKGTAAILGRVVVSVVIYGIVFFGMLGKCHRLFNKGYWIYALKFNVPLIPHFLSLMILQQSDRIMIERMYGEKDAAFYSVAYQAACALQIVNAAILNSFVPYTYRAIKSGHKEKIGQLSIGLLVGIGALNLLAVLLAPEMIHILAPEEYMSAVYIIPPVAMSNMFMLLFNLFANIEYYWGKTRYVAVASLISAVTNIVLNFVFINRHGFIAAGYTTLACYILFSICHYAFMRKVSRTYMDGYQVYDIKKIIVITFSFTVLALGVTAIYSFTVLRYGIVIIMAVVVFVKRKLLSNIYGGMKESEHNIEQ